MSLEKFSEILYKDLPSQNLAFVEGGVLIYPEMLGQTIPLKMTDADMFRYLTLYSSVMEKLSSAKNQDQGKALTQQVAKELQIDPEKFQKDNINILMLESILAQDVLPMDFKNVQKMYQKQKARADVILADLQFDVSNDVKDSAKKISKDFTGRKNNVNKPVQEGLSIEPPYTTAPPPASPPVPNAALTKVQNKSSDSSGLAVKVKELATKPSVLIGVASLGVVAYLLIPKKKKTGYRS